jgi:hypothetical protein
VNSGSEKRCWRKSPIFDLLRVADPKHKKSGRLRSVAYMTAGTNHPGVEKSRDAYTARLVYQDPVTAGTTGIGTHRFNSMAGYNAGATALLAAAGVTAAHAGTPVHDTENDSFSVTVRCHDPNGELYNVTFSRDRVTVQSYLDDAILAKVETWADTVPALA